LHKKRVINLKWGTIKAYNFYLKHFSIPWIFNEIQGKVISVFALWLTPHTQFMHINRSLLFVTTVPLSYPGHLSTTWKIFECKNLCFHIWMLNACSMECVVRSLCLI
jgi:hypothetical protein